VNVCYLALFHYYGKLDVRWHIAGVNPKEIIYLKCVVGLSVNWFVAW